MSATIPITPGTSIDGIRIADMPDLGGFTDVCSVVGEHAGSGRFAALALRSYVISAMAAATQFATIAALRANTAYVSAGMQVSVAGYYAAADGAGGAFIAMLSDTTSADNAGTVIVDAVAQRWYRDTQDMPLSVTWFGARGDGTSDDTTAFRNAIATGQSVRIPKSPTPYILRDAVTCTTFGQIIAGDGKAASVIQIGSTFNLSAQGVFVINTPPPLVPAPQFRDFSIAFVQPDTTVKSSLTSYPPAFYSNNQSRGVWRGVKVSAAMTAFALVGNPGGTSIVDCEISAFNDHIAIDGAADTVTVENCRFEGDTLTANQMTIYTSPTQGGIGIHSGRCDDLSVAACLFYCGTGLATYQGSGGNTTFGTLVNCAFDTTSGLAMAGGELVLSACYFTAASAGVNPVSVSAGVLAMSSTWFYAAVPLTNGFVLLSPSSGNTISCQIAGGAMDTSCGDMFGIQAFGNTLLNVAAMTFSAHQGTALTHAVLQINSGALLSMTGCRLSAASGGSGNLIVLAADGAHNVTGNALGGYGAQLPAGHTQLMYANNN